MSEFLCPSCTYGHLLRICHEPPHYGEGQYICKDMSKLDPAKKPAVVMAGGTKIMDCPPSIFDYEDGPGGWDGKTCINFERRKEE
jgi:hypothetical protein